MLIAMSVFGQTFRVSVELPEPVASGRATLTIWDGTQGRPQYSARVREGRCHFEGRLLRDQPFWAEVRHPSLGQPIGFFLERGNLRLTDGHVYGSESHSQWEYLRRGDALAFVRDNPGHLLSPSLLYMSDAPYAELQPLFDSLRDEALHSSHYPALRQRLAQMALSAEGARLPDSLLRPDGPTLLLFATPWCEPCQRAADSLAEFNPVILNVEDDPTLWDRFALPHIPFLLLASPEGIILERDLRWWEAKRILNP